MASISDTIEKFILSLISVSDQGVEVQRNELANHFSCAPSQINYVLSTRFSLDRGYIIESKRGGGGYVRIIKLNIGKDDYVMHILNHRLTGPLTKLAAGQLLESLCIKEIISLREAGIMAAGLTDKAIAVPSGIKDNIRCNILRSMLIKIMEIDRASKN